MYSVGETNSFLIHFLQVFPVVVHIDFQPDKKTDGNKDTYDGGLHLNLAGAEKMSQYFGKVLSDEFNVPDRRGEAELDSYWKQVSDRYYAEIDRQNTNLELYGTVHDPEENN